MHDNRALVQKCLDCFNRHQVGDGFDVFAEDLVNHGALPEAQGRAGLSMIWEKIWAAFPDAVWTCQDMVAEGDRVVCRVHMRGTQSGPLRLACLPLPASGRVLDSEGIYIFRLLNGQIVELWFQRDEVRMLRQLGHLPLVGAET